jgi:hypothetical protein
VADLSGVAEPLRTLAPELRGLLAESRKDEEPDPLLIAGAPALVAELRGVLTAGGEPRLVTIVTPGEDGAHGPEASAFVYAIDGQADAHDEDALRIGDRWGVPLVCLMRAGEAAEGGILPYVPATRVVRAPALDAETFERVADKIVAATGDDAWALARRLPALRGATARMLISRATKQNARLGARSAPGSGMPALTLNQMRAVARLFNAHGQQVHPALLAVVFGAGFGFRTLAHTLAGSLPIPARLVRAGIAYAGTRAVGEAALMALARLSASEPLVPWDRRPGATGPNRASGIPEAGH